MFPNIASGFDIGVAILSIEAIVYPRYLPNEICDANYKFIIIETKLSEHIRSDDLKNIIKAFLISNVQEPYVIDNVKILNIFHFIEEDLRQYF